MMSAAAYLLKVPAHRREILLEEDYGFGRYFSDDSPPAGEPVPRFDHSRRAPLIVFACFADDAITHIAEGRKGTGAGRGLVVLNMRALQPLSRPIAFRELLERAPSRLTVHLRRVLSAGGKLPPKSLGAVVDIVLALQPDLGPRLARFSERRAEILSRLTPPARENLAIQKETLTAALQIAGLGTDEVLAWSPGQGVQRSFLEGLPQAYVREDAAVAADFGTIPGFDAIKNFPFAARVFENAANPSLRLTVIMANHLRLEEQTGADLIYYNETYQSFVLVQYKAMDRGNNGPEFRWRLGDKLCEEIGRMDALLTELAAMPQDPSPASFRLQANPFFLKLCPRVVFNPDDKGLCGGLYLPLEFWRCLANDPASEGPRQGRVLSYANVGRKLTNSEFITLVANAWVGTTAPQSALLRRVIEGVIETGRTVTLAVKSGGTVDPQDSAEEASL